MNEEARKWIESQKPLLVAWAEDYVRVAKPHYSQNHPKPGGKARVSTSQFRVLLSAAQAGNGLAVLANLLRYQIGRGNNGWRHRESGEVLLGLLDTKLAPLCQQATSDGDHHRLEIEARLAAQLLGFVLREHTYGCAVKRTKSR